MFKISKQQEEDSIATASKTYADILNIRIIQTKTISPFNTNRTRLDYILSSFIYEIILPYHVLCSF